MQYTFNVETKRNVNPVGDYSIVSYRAEHVGEADLPRDLFSGSVKVSPHDANADEIIGRDILEQIRNYRNNTVETTTVTVNDTDAPVA